MAPEPERGPEDLEPVQDNGDAPVADPGGDSDPATREGFEPPPGSGREASA